MTLDELEAARVRRSTAALLDKTSDELWGGLAVQMSDAAARVLSESETAAVVARVYPSLVSALALAFERETDALPLADVAAVLGVTPGALLRASAARRLKLEIVRRRGRPFVRREDLDRLLRRPTPDVDPLGKLLGEAVLAALPAARERAEPPLTLSAEEAGRELGLTRKQLWARVTNGTLDLKRIHVGGRVVRFSAADVARVAGGATTRSRQ